MIQRCIMSNVENNEQIQYRVDDANSRVYYYKQCL